MPSNIHPFIFNIFTFTISQILTQFVLLNVTSLKLRVLQTSLFSLINHHIRTSSILPIINSALNFTDFSNKLFNICHLFALM